MKYPRFAAFSRPFLAALLVVGVGMFGVATNHFSSAATYTNFDAVGSIDSCTLSGSTTTIYGWGNDPDATVAEYPHVSVTAGGTTVTAKTDITYRSSAINSYIAGRFPNQPTNPPYGYTVTFTNLYKGTAYLVTGTAINRGADGASTSLMYNNPKDTSAGKSFFTSSTLPSTCQPDAPAAPPPVGGGGSSGGGTGGTGGGTGGGSSSGGSHSGGGSSATAAPAAPTADADAVVKAGTLSAIFNIPAGNATTIHVDYNAPGIEPSSSPDQVVTGDTATLELDILSAKTDYAYQIVRTNSAGAVAVSPLAGFTTEGYSVSMKFVDAHKKPVSGIAGSIDQDTRTKAKSDKNGQLKFTDLEEGTHTVSYTYLGKEHSAQFDTTTASTPEDPTATVNLSNTVDVSKFTPGSSKKSGGSGGVVLVIFGLIALFVAAWFGLRKWRQRQALRRMSPSAPGAADILDKHSLQQFAKHQSAPAPLPEHAGQSLRDMVVQSMHGQGPTLTEHAASTQVPAPLPPPVPPQPAPAPKAEPEPPKPAHKPAHKKPDADDTELHIQH